MEFILLRSMFPTIIESHSIRIDPKINTPYLYILYALLYVLYNLFYVLYAQLYLFYTYL
jgi:hypothetical protein